MDGVNRVLNRVFLAGCGLLTLAGGALLAVLALSPASREAWRALGIGTPRDGLALAIPVGGIRVPLVVLVAIAAALVAIALLLILAAGRRAGRRVRPIQSLPLPEPGESVSADTAVAGQTLRAALDGRRGIGDVRVVARRVRRRPVLRVDATVERGWSPLAARRDVEEAVEHLDHVLGVRLPVLVELRPARARAARVE